MVEVIYSVLERIKNTSSRNEKEKILKEFENDNDIQRVLKFLYNDLIVTGLSDKKIKKETGVIVEDYPKTLFDTFDYLLKHNTGTDRDIATVQNVIKSLSNDEKVCEFLEQLLTKTYKAGITAKTLNKVYGNGFAPNFGCMLGQDFSKVCDVIKGRFYLTVKLDGQRLLAIVDNEGRANLFSRNGKPQFGLKEITSGIYDLANNFILTREKFSKGFVLDGEVLANNPNIQNDKTCSETISIMSSKDEFKTGLSYHIFDIIPLDEFIAGASTDNYSERRKMLNQTMTSVDGDILRIVETIFEGEDKSVIIPILNQVEKDGQEGLMINLDQPYVTKRTNALIKVKSFNTADLKVVDIFKGDGLLKNTLGGIVVEYKGSKVKVGSGFTFSERDYFFENPKKIIGKIVEVKYFSESTNKKDNTISLRFPTFVRVREDKNEPNE